MGIPISFFPVIFFFIFFSFFSRFFLFNQTPPRMRVASASVLMIVVATSALTTTEGADFCWKCEGDPELWLTEEITTEDWIAENDCEKEICPSSSNTCHWKLELIDPGKLTLMGCSSRSKEKRGNPARDRFYETWCLDPLCGY